MIGSYVVVCTEWRGVFFGKLISHDEDKKIAELDESQLCVYWSQATHGVLGLASVGPGKDCRISPQSGKVKLAGVTAIFEVDDSAISKWKESPWS